MIRNEGIIHIEGNLIRSREGRSSKVLSLFLKDATLLQVTVVFGKAFKAFADLLQKSF